MKKLLKILLIILAVLVAAFAVLAMMAPRKYDFSRSIYIKADKQIVWDQISLWKNFNNWSPWFELDTAMKQQIEGTDGETGSKYSWESKAAGSGDMVNTVMKPLESREYELRFADWDGMSVCAMTLKDSAGGSIVSWSMKGENGAVGAVFMYLMGGIEKAVGKDYEKGLKKLKDYCEKFAQPAGKVGEVMVKPMPKMLFVQHRRQMPMDDYLAKASALFQEGAGKVMAHIEANKLQMRGTLFGIYYKWDEKARQTDFAVAIPVDREAGKGGDISFVTLGGNDCAVVEYWGDYAGTSRAHMALEAWLKANGKSMADAPAFEEYVTDPATEKDPMKVLTRVWYPLGK